MAWISSPGCKVPPVTPEDVVYIGRIQRAAEETNTGARNALRFTDQVPGSIQGGAGPGAGSGRAGNPGANCITLFSFSWAPSSWTSRRWPLAGQPHCCTSTSTWGKPASRCVCLWLADFPLGWTFLGREAWPVVNPFRRGWHVGEPRLPLWPLVSARRPVALPPGTGLALPPLPAVPLGPAGGALSFPASLCPSELAVLCPDQGAGPWHKASWEPSPGE